MEAEKRGLALTRDVREDFLLCSAMCNALHMAANLSLDPDLIERALEVSGERTKKAAVARALEEVHRPTPAEALTRSYGEAGLG